MVKCIKGEQFVQSLKRCRVKFNGESEQRQQQWVRSGEQQDNINEILPPSRRFPFLLGVWSERRFAIFSSLYTFELHEVNGKKGKKIRRRRPFS